jgi:outer membrane protein OmpA-like peptidoglycan-associated protein
VVGVLAFALPALLLAAAAPVARDEIDALLDEFMATSEAIRRTPAGEDVVRFIGPEERPNWFQALVVTHEENPLLEEECKKKAFSVSVETLRRAHGFTTSEEALSAATAHMRERQDYARSHDVSYADYLSHLAECKAFCGPVVAHLIECQVLSVSRNPHGIVLFDLGSDEVDTRYSEGVLEKVSALLEHDEGRKIALVGRASRIGDLEYNRRLSARRALAVRDELIANDVGSERIKTMWLGWEPPQIGSWIAAEYGIENVLADAGELGVNQSVMVVVY